MPSTTGDMPGIDGRRLRTRRWSPAARPWGRIVIVHGAGDHSGRYERMGEPMARAGLDVHAFDLPGQGGSDGARGDVERWDRFTDEAVRALARARHAEPAVPSVLLGHSMGALVVLDAALSGTARPDALVLSGPALRDGIAGWVHAIAPIAARIAPRVVVRNTWDGSYLSRDPEIGRASAADPLTAKGATLRLAAAGFEAQARMRAAVEGRRDLPVPTLVVHGGDDRLVPTACSEVLGRLENVTRRVYPGLRHETFMEPEGPEVVADIVAWLRATLAPGEGRQGAVADRV